MQFHLTGLAALGVVIPDPAPDPARWGQRTHYELDTDRVDEPHTALGRHVGARS